LPLESIVPAYEVGKVVINKNPGLAGLSTWQQAPLGTPAHFLRMHVKKRRRLSQIDRLHGFLQIVDGR
jgi:hypothetical protein